MSSPDRKPIPLRNVSFVLETGNRIAAVTLSQHGQEQTMISTTDKSLAALTSAALVGAAAVGRRALWAHARPPQNGGVVCHVA